jgi:type IX secretion system PorP/SprF family membrane protein
MSMKKTILSFIALLILHQHTIAQDIHFSQFYMAPLMQNPALAGAERSSEAMLNYRSQWQSVADPYSTMSATAHTRIGSTPGKNYFALGINFFQDQSGDAKMRTLQAGLALAYHVRIGRNHTLGLGVRADYGQLSVDSRAFQWGSQYSGNGYDPGIDPGETLDRAAFSYPDISSGLVWSYNNTSGKGRVQRNNYRQGSFGISVFHLNRPEYSFFGSGQRLFPKMVLHGRFLLSIPASKIALNPGFMFYRQGPNSEMLLGSMIRYDLISESKYTGVYKTSGIYLGGYLRAGDAFVISSMFEFDLISIGFEL